MLYGLYRIDHNFLSNNSAVPSTPVNFTVEDLGSTSATISWALSDDGGSPVTMTYLSYKTQGNRTPVYVRVTGDTSEYHLTGLDFNSSLTVSLSAANAMGEGPTALFSFSTRDVPDAPPYVTSSTVQDAAAVCWPSTSLGQPYLLYRVKVQAPGSALDGTMVDIKPTSATQSNGTTCVKVRSGGGGGGGVIGGLYPFCVTVSVGWGYPFCGRGYYF